MATKVLSIEVGESVTRVIEMDHGAKTPKLYNAFSFETPPDTLSDDSVNVNENMVALMRQGLSQNGIRTNKAVFTISSSRIASREVTIPLVKDNKIKPLLIANSRDYFPVDLSEYELVYRILERMKEQKQLKLSVYAVPRVLITSYQQLAKAWGLQIESLDYSGNSVSQAMLHSLDPALSVTLCVNDRSSMVTLIKDGKVELQRNIGYGIDDAVEVVRRDKGIPDSDTYMQALEVLRERTCFNQQLSEEDSDYDDWNDLEDEEIMKIRGPVTKSMTMLVGNISRVLDYYTSRNAEVTIDEIHLVGLGAECKGLDKLLTRELGVDVVSVRDKKGVNVSRSLARSHFSVAEYFVPIGATFEPLNFSMAGQITGEEKAKAESLSMALIIFLGCVVLAAVGVMLPMMENMNLEDENDAMRAEIQSKQSVVELYNNYVVLKKTDEELRAADQNATVPNDAFLEFLGEMEEKMPKDFKVDTLSVSENTMTIAAACTSKASVAEVLMQLRTFDTVFDVSCSSVAESVNDAGVVEENFDITVIYAPQNAEEDTEEEGVMETTEAQ